MISGITIAKNISHFGFPYALSIKSFLNACDEIIIVTDYSDKETISLLMRQFKDEPRVKIRGVSRVNSFEVFRMIGYFFTSSPDFVVHFDLDYLISLEDSKTLRNSIIKNPTADIITYNLVYLNYWGDKTIYDSEMAKYVYPNDGITGQYPFVLNVKKGNMICPFEGTNEDNVAINFESVISLNPERWGAAYDNKWLRNNPYQFEIYNSTAVIEHLSWSLNRDALLEKLALPHWSSRNIDEEYVKMGETDYLKSYEELNSLRDQLNEQS